MPEGKITLIRNAISRRAVSPRHGRGRRAARHRRGRRSSPSARSRRSRARISPSRRRSRCSRRDCDVQTLVVGDAAARGRPNWCEYVARLRERVAAAGASDRVHFVGARENMLEIMKASYVLAAPILQEETFGNVALEARSVGLPVVTFARGGLTELVEPWGHWLRVRVGRSRRPARRLAALPRASGRARRGERQQPGRVGGAGQRLHAGRVRAPLVGDVREGELRQLGTTQVRRRQVREVRGVGRVPLARNRTGTDRP